MPRILLVRHGRAAAGWDQDPDPGLDPEGHAQAAALAAALAPRGPLPLVVSPLRRTRDTIAPLEAAWNTTARVDLGVGEIPSPTDDLEARGQWLRAVMRGTWTAQPPELVQWRTRVLATLREIAAATPETVVVSHFVAINVAVGAATGDDRLVCFAPDYCSCTAIDIDGTGRFTVLELGGQAGTVVF